MKLIHIALCACALSACALDEDEGTQSTIEAARRIRLTGKLDLNPNCSNVDITARWTEAQVNQVDVVFLVTDLVTSDFLSFTVSIDPNATSALLVGQFMQPLQMGGHKILLGTQLRDINGAVVLEDTTRQRLPCFF